MKKLLLLVLLAECSCAIQAQMSPKCHFYVYLQKLYAIPLPVKTGSAVGNIAQVRKSSARVSMLNREYFIKNKKRSFIEKLTAYAVVDSLDQIIHVLKPKNDYEKTLLQISKDVDISESVEWLMQNKASLTLADFTLVRFLAQDERIWDITSIEMDRITGLESIRDLLKNNDGKLFWRKN